MRRIAVLAGVLATVVPASVHAQNAGGAKLRDYCPERPGLDTPACIVDTGHVSVETSLADWTLDNQPETRTDTVLIGDTVVRVGVTDRIEARVGWTPFGHQRQRDQTSGIVDTADRVGDLTLGTKINLANPDGDKLSVAVLPFVSLPIGRTPIGAGDWGAGLLLPITYALGDALQIEATGEVDAAVDQGGRGRHLAYSGTGGLGYKLSKKLTLTGEWQTRQDDDPAQPTTQSLAALSLGYTIGNNLQLDVLGAVGANRDAPSHEICAGISRRF